MDLALVLQVTVVALALIGVVLWFIGAELRWQGRQREEQHRELLLALFRISKGHLKALEDRARRGDELSASLLRALPQRDPHEVRAALPEAAHSAGEIPPPSSPPER